MLMDIIWKIDALSSSIPEHSSLFVSLGIRVNRLNPSSFELSSFALIRVKVNNLYGRTA